MSGWLQPALLAAAAGLALSRASWRLLGLGLLALAATAVIAGLIEPRLPPIPALASGGWVLIAALAASALWPGEPGPRRALILAAVAGVGVGLLAGFTPQLAAMPCALIAVPAAWLVRSGRGIAVKVAAGWLIAVALLAGALPLLTTPGDVPDHME